MKNTKKKLVSLILASLLVVTILPTSINAQELTTLPEQETQTIEPTTALEEPTTAEEPTIIEDDTQPVTQLATETATVTKEAESQILNNTIGTAFEIDGLIITTENHEAYDRNVDENAIVVTGSDQIIFTNAKSGTEIDTKIVIDSGVTANITLAGVNINVDDDNDNIALEIRNNATLNLFLPEASSSTLRSGNHKAGLQVNSGATLNIIDSSLGKLTAISSNDGAGIGSAKDENPGNINIYGGNIIAISEDDGAGIGGGMNGDSGNINIYGGTVNATSNTDGAGIGGGDSGNGKNITIHGGTVTATSKDGGAGIGAGVQANSGYIYIKGGNVTARAEKHGAGIGSGDTGGFIGFGEDGGICEYVEISGSTTVVNASSGGDGAGIGSSFDGKSNTIVINDGNVTASSEGDGAGIGSGARSSLYNLTINGGTINANGGSNAAAIGTGAFYEDIHEDEDHYYAYAHIHINGGDITANGGSEGCGIGGGSQTNTDTTIDITGGNIKAYGGTGRTESGAGIGGSSQSGEVTINISGGNIYAKGGDNATGIGHGTKDCVWYDIFITGGYVEAVGTGEASGIGRNYDKGIFSDYKDTYITISGGIVKATPGSSNAKGISGLDGGPSPEEDTFTTGDNGHAVIYTTSIADVSEENKLSGIFFLGENSTSGEIYGTPKMTEDYTLKSNETLTFNEGDILSFDNGTTFTVEKPADNSVQYSVIGTGIISVDGTLDETIVGRGYISSTILLNEMKEPSGGFSINQEPIIIQQSPLHTDKNVMYYNGTTYEFYSDTIVDINGTGEITSNNITIEEGVSARIILFNVHIDTSNTKDKAAIELESNATLDLSVFNNNIVTSGENKAGVNLNTGCTLTISEYNSTGRLEATGGTNGAGIGGGNNIVSPKIIINSGTIKATGGDNGAGIGSGNGDTDSTSDYGGTDPTIDINGGEITAIGKLNGAGIGSGYNGGGGNITIGDKAIVNATADNGAAIGTGANESTFNSSKAQQIEITDYAKVTANSITGSGIGGGYNESSGTIIISGDSEVTASSQRESAGIGSGANNDAIFIDIKGNAIVTANGGEFAASIGSGIYGKCIGISISDNASVTAIGNYDKTNSDSYTGAGIGCSYYGTNYDGTNIAATAIAIGIDTTVIATSNNTVKPAIDVIHGVISKPNDSTELANVIQLNYTSLIPANTENAVSVNSIIAQHYSLDTAYQSLAFTGLDKGKKYNLYTNHRVQEWEKTGILQNTSSIYFTIEEGLNTYNNVHNYDDREQYTVAFVDKVTRKVISIEYVSYGEDAHSPHLPIFREYEYLPNFEETELTNITSHKVFTYEQTLKTFDVTADISSNVKITYQNSSTENTVFNYGEIAKATYTGTGTVIGWEINGELVSVTNSNVYAFYVDADCIVTPVLDDSGQTIMPNVSINGVNVQVKTDSTAKIYYSIFATGYNPETVQYGVVRSTNESDLIQNISAERLLANDFFTFTGENLQLHSPMEVMNSDGRYNYVAVVPTDTDKTLYTQAWIQVGQYVYYSDIVAQTPSSYVQ